MHPISIKDLRKNLSKVATEVENGESFIVLRHSTPCFKIVPFSKVIGKNDPYKNIGEVNINEESGEWEQLMDFTENGTKNGLPADKFFETLEKIIKKEERIYL